MARALSVTEVLSMKKKELAFEGEWKEAFGAPEKVGVWFIWGNSGNGKSSFVMQLCRELARFGKVAYNSLEEGVGLTMKNSLQIHGMQDINRKLLLLECESMKDLSDRLVKRRSPDFVIIDSFQYTQMTYKEYIRFKEWHRDKLLIFISHAEGNKPEGRSAKKVMYDASLKIWVEGFRAFSKGRFIGSTGQYTIWSERAEIYWGEKDKQPQGIKL